MAVVTLPELVAEIGEGCLVAIPRDYSGVAMAATRELVRAGAGGLGLLAVPTTGLQADILIGAGRVAEVEAAAVSLGEAGPAPRSSAARRAGGGARRRRASRRRCGRAGWRCATPPARPSTPRCRRPRRASLSCRCAASWARMYW